MQSKTSRLLGDLPIGKIAADPRQPRKCFDQAALERLARSIKKRGILLPLSVRSSSETDQWILISGERRFRAAALAGLPAVPCVLATRPLTASDILEEQLIENLHREELDALDRARAFALLMKKNGWKKTQLAAQLDLEPSTVTRALRLLRLPAELQEQVKQRRLAPRTGYELSKLRSPGQQAEVAQEVIDKKLPATRAAKLIRQRGGFQLTRKPSAASPATTMVYELPGGGKVSVTLPKQPVTTADVFGALETAIGLVRLQMAA